MYDFNKFIELLNKEESFSSALNKSLKLIRADFYLGKISIVSNDLIINENYAVDDFSDKAIKVYMSHDFKYSFYSNKENHNYSKEELLNIDLLLKLISLNHINSIMEKKANEAEFISLNTRLPNTHGYRKKVMEIAKRVDARNYNAYFINIKGFGLVNKLFGSAQGDLAIKEYAKKLENFMEEDEVLGHLGGDNFVAFIKRDRHNAFVELVTMCPVELVRNNKNTVVNLIGIIGYEEISSNEVSYDELLSHPSIACQYARNTKKIIVKNTKELMDMINSVKSIESTFKEELQKGSFVVYYQPKFDIKTGKIIGVEALSRWINNGNVVPPAVFVPILEKNGEIFNLDLYVLENLCKDIHNYRNLGHIIVPASCNLSRRDFENDNLEQIVIDIIKKYNVRTEDIVIEVTETTSLEENERLAKFINEMHKNGIMTSIDDFGTGYSSLSVLRDFKVSEIKIDRSFINREALSESDEIIIGSIIDMAKRLNINVICEGVENEEQAEFLVKLGCNNAQGFLYSKPLPKLEFEALMQKIGTVYDNK